MNNLKIDYLGIWNEPPEVLLYDLANFTKYLRQQLDSHAYSDVKNIVGDVRGWNITKVS